MTYFSKPERYELEAFDDKRCDPSRYVVLDAETGVVLTVLNSVYAAAEYEAPEGVRVNVVECTLSELEQIGLAP